MDFADTRFSDLSPIRQLPDHLINRIAAGEVVERPAAALKELVENAIDAGATRIDVTVDEGGMSRMVIADNGCGLSQEGLALAVQRHCTSKLPGEDLENIATLGFRGEALPSIGAAARLHIVSRQVGSPNAWHISVEGGVTSEVTPSSGTFGTRVTVSDLFFSIPARRKFLKTPRVEGDQCEATVRRLAFSAPHIAFSLTSNGRVSLQLPVQTWQQRVAALCVEGESQAFLPELHHERDGMVLTGLICAPTASRKTTAGQSLVVNGRPVSDPVLRTAVKVGYRDVIDFGRHPVVALYLSIPPGDVDVNVHPSKNELRFRSADAVRGLVIGTLSRALSGGAGHAPHRSSFGAKPAYRTTPPAQNHLSTYTPMPPVGAVQARLMDVAPTAKMVEPEAMAEPEAGHPLGAAMAQMLNTYILAVSEDGSLVLVDQHAAHERLTHEAIAVQHKAGGVKAQSLLIPDVVEMPVGDAERLLEQADFLASLGLELEAFGQGVILVRSVPLLLTRHGAPDIKALLRDLADELAESGISTALEARLDAAISRLACHGSIRAGRSMRPDEMNAMLRQMESTPRAATCSHGRPTFIKISQAEIERMFGRRQ